jgi:hypothetical protein
MDFKVNVPVEVPATPRTGVTVQAEAVVVELFGTAPATALVAFNPP